MEQRRKARVGTVSGLALLTGGTAAAAVAGGRHSIFATLLLGMLACGMGHALTEEIRRQARRTPVGGWAVPDTVNTALLAAWTAGAALATVLAVAPVQVRAVAGALALGYAVTCGYFVTERRRTITTSPPGSPAASEPSSSIPAPVPADGPPGR